MKDAEGSKGGEFRFTKESVHKVASADIEMDRFQLLEAVWTEREVIEVDVLSSSATAAVRAVGSTSWGVDPD